MHPNAHKRRQGGSIERKCIKMHTKTTIDTHTKENKKQP